MKWMKRIILVVLLLGTAGALYYILVIRRSNPNLKNATPDYTVTMPDLFKEITANDSSAKLKYINKVVQITGNVKELLINDSTATVNLGDSASSSLIICQIDNRNKDNIAAIKPNTTITIKGKFAAIKNQNTDPTFADMGIDLGTNIDVNFCAVMK
jgi:hypothetical protein